MVIRRLPVRIRVGALYTLFSSLSLSLFLSIRLYSQDRRRADPYQSLPPARQCSGQFCFSFLGEHNKQMTTKNSTSSDNGQHIRSYITACTGREVPSSTKETAHYLACIRPHAAHEVLLPTTLSRTWRDQPDVVAFTRKVCKLYHTSNRHSCW